MPRPQGFHHSETTKLKMSKSQKGRKLSSEHRKKLSDGHWSKKPGAERIKQHLANISTGVVPSMGTRKKLSKANTGRKFSAESIQRMSDAAKRREQVTLDKIHATNVAIGRYCAIGETRINKGYVIVKMFHHRGQRNWVSQHRVIMGQSLGRPLQRNEHVHHVDGNQLNNNINNLALLSSQDHASLNHIIRFIKIADKRIVDIIIKTLLHRFPDLDILKEQKNFLD